jgi:hypothetical protein
VLQVVIFGRVLTLLKSVLESQPVYWMSLAAIPFTVLNNLRKIMFNFLWKGNNESNHYHLCKWELLTIPKKYGGWGLRNIFDFNKALAANSLWRVLMRDGIWHKVIIDKYLPHTTVKNWFRSPTFHQNTRIQNLERSPEISSLDYTLVKLVSGFGSSHCSW